MSRIIIGLAGPAGAGKTEVAKHLVDQYGFKRHGFAEPLKRMLAALGVPHECLCGSRKNEPLDILGGKTARWAMQTLGTEWGRDLIGPQLWVRAWLNDIGSTSLLLGYNHTHVIDDDVRFGNEIDVIRKLGGFIVHVSRPGHEGAGVGKVHASERLGSSFVGGADVKIINHSTGLDDLRASADDMMEIVHEQHERRALSAA